MLFQHVVEQHDLFATLNRWGGEVMFQAAGTPNVKMPRSLGKMQSERKF